MTRNGNDTARMLLAGWPVVIEMQVAWGEMDAYAHVNNAVYFRYFENARIGYFDAIGYTGLMHSHGHGPILAQTSCRFRAPLRYPDRIAVGARVRSIGADRFEMEYALASTQLGLVAAEGSGLIVAYDYRAAARMPLPESIRTRIGELQPELAAPPAT